MLFNGTKITTEADLEKLSGKDLLALFNQATGKSTSKFASRAKGLAQTWKALQSAAPRVEKLVEKSAEQEKQGHGLSFRLPPRDLTKQPRGETKRAKVFNACISKEGALFSEIQKLCKWSRKDAYEGVRLLNTYCGFGLWHERVDADDYRIFIVTPARYKQLVERETSKS